MAGLDQEIDHRASAGEQRLARQTPPAAIGGRRLGWVFSFQVSQDSLEIDERLQVLGRHALFGQLRDDRMQAFLMPRASLSSLSGPCACARLSALSAVPMRSIDGESVCMMPSNLGVGVRIVEGVAKHLASIW